MGAALLALLLSVVFLPAFLGGRASDTARRFAMPVARIPASPTPFYTERFIDAEPASTSLHVPTLTELPGGNLLAVWKAAKVAERPVALNAATYDLRAGRWGPVRQVTTSEQTEAELERVVTTFTNPVLVNGAGGTVMLFYVTSWHKWSMAAITVKSSTNGGKTWTLARRVVSSPVGNLGTLVKAAPVPYADGSIGLPAYQEFYGVLPQFLRFSPDGRLLDKVRIQRADAAFQPSIVPVNEHEALAFMRSSVKGSVLLARTPDAGRSWTPIRSIGLPNPNSPVMALRLRDGSLLLAFNDSPRWRENLSLALSRDGGERWVVFHRFEVGLRDEHGALENFSYPYVIQSADGTVHVLYVWRLAHVKHVSFNEAWIAERSR